jgi:competence protein ComEA
MQSLFERRRDALIGLAAVLALLVLLGRVLVHAGTPHGGTAAAVAPLSAPVAAKPQAVVVDVVGAVRRAGLYRMREGDRIDDAVARAGGPTAKADLEQINLAAPLADGEQVVVPRRGAATAAGTAEGATTGPVHLSTASAEELDALPGVGPVTAEKIVAYREAHGAFKSVEELDAIPGIGPARLAQLQGLVAP